MLAASSNQGQETPVNEIPPSKKHKWYKRIFIITAGLALISVALFYIVGGSMTTDETNMEKYLQDKYGQEFDVTDLKDRAVALGDPGQRVGIGHPISDSGLTFEVGKNRKTGVYFDGYSGAVWEREERPRVAAFLQTIYSASTTPNFDLTTHIPTPAAPDPIRGKVPNINDAMTRYKENFFYSLTLKLTADRELSQDEIETHIAHLKEVIKFLLEKNVSHPMIRYAINIEDQDAGYLCNLSQNKLTDTSSIDACLKKINGKAW